MCRCKLDDGCVCISYMYFWDSRQIGNSLVEKKLKFSQVKDFKLLEY